MTTRRQFAEQLLALGLLSARSSPGESTPMRIISTAPSSTEALFALGLGAHVVGVSTFCEYPPEVKALPRVGTYVQPNIELIVRLRPDLVALQRHPGPVPDRLHALGIRTVDMPYGTLEDVYTGIDLLAHAAGVPDRGAALNTSIRGRLAAIRAEADRRSPVRACIIADRRPGTLADLIAVGPNNYVNQLCTIAGGVNPLDQPALPQYPRISLESLLRASPDVLIDLTDAHELDAAHAAQRQQDLALWDQQQLIPAVRAHRVFLGDNAVLLVPGPRTPEAAAQFFRFLHEPHA